MGDKLKVATVLEGSVRKAGDRLRITAQLVNVADGYHLWSERFDRTMDDIFDVQDEIATRIAEKLKLTLADEPDQPIVRQVTKNAEAYDLYLKGRFFLAQRGEGIQKALDCFQKALELDPHFAPAHSGKADAYSFLGLYNFWPPKKAFPMARTAANDALALDETLADAHVSLAMVSFYHDWDWPASARAHREALTLKPDHAPAHSRFVLYYSSLGRFDEAYAEARRGLELDPFSLEASINLFWADYLARHHEEGIRHARATLEIHPNVAEVFRLMGVHHSELSQFDDAIRCFVKALSIWPDGVWAAVSLAFTFARCGRTGEARKWLGELENRSEKSLVAPVVFALLHGFLGDFDAAFEWLERSYQARDFWLVMLNVEPGYDPLRSDPRFDDLVKRVGIPDGKH